MCNHFFETDFMYKKKSLFGLEDQKEDIFFSQAKSTNASDVMYRVHGTRRGMYNIWVLVTILRLSIDGPVQSNVF